MKNYWNNLNPREQGMVIFTGIILTLYSGYFLIFSPLNKALITGSDTLAEQVKTLNWMEMARLQDHVSNKKKNLTNSQLLTLLANQLKTKALAPFPYQIQQTSNGDIQLTYNEMPYSAFIQWLGQLDTEYEVTIKQLNIERTEKSGVVKLLLTVTAGS